MLMSVRAFRRNLVEAALHHYPFLRGGARVANSGLVRRLSGELEGTGWARTRSGALVLTPFDDYMGRMTYFIGDTDPAISRLCKILLRPGDVALDIGAHLGIMTVLMARLVGQTGRVHAFEPNPNVRELLLTSLERNAITNVEVHGVALGAHEDVLPLIVPRGHIGNASLLHRADDGEAVQVPVRRLSDVLDGVDLTSIRLAKLDVEGYEREALAGALPLFERVLPDAVVCECWNLESAEGRALAHDLLELGYRVFAVARTLIRLRLVPLGRSDKGVEFSQDILAIRPNAITSEIASCISSL
jgi:FkbM family methyltransferase